MPYIPPVFKPFFSKGNIRIFMAGIITVVILLISFNKIYCTANPINKINTGPKKLSFCEKIDSITHEQTRGFSAVKGKISFNDEGKETWYRSTIDVGSDSCYVLVLHKTNASYKGFFSTKANNDSASSAQLYDSLKLIITNCLSPQWQNHGNLIDSDNNFPFTRFVKDSTQIELYYRKNGDGPTYTIGLVVMKYK